FHMNPNTIAIPKKGSVFSTFEKARAFIENYAAHTNTVIFLAKTTKNKDGSGYRQEQYNGKKEKYITKQIGCSFVARINYSKHEKKFAITKLCLEHNHEVNPDARKFSSNMRKFDLNELGMIRELHNNGLRIKDIYAILTSISSKYTLQNDENIMLGIATKPAYNDECDQDGSFIQAIFWAYRSAVFEFAIAKD
ncbi:29232_t:CDS:2, partial [Racocetra persica]